MEIFFAFYIYLFNSLVCNFINFIKCDVYIDSNEMPENKLLFRVTNIYEQMIGRQVCSDRSSRRQKPFIVLNLATSKSVCKKKKHF
jgi:hypothetical protein